MGYGSGLPDWIPSFTYQPYPPLQKAVHDFGRTGLVVDLGAGGRKVAPHVTTVDFAELPGTDVVCDFVKDQTPFEDGSVDMVIGTGILEHVENDRPFLKEVHRMLRTGGVAHIELPFLQQYHDDPIDCRRLTVPGLAGLLEQEGFEIIESGAHIGPTVTLLTLTSYYLDLLFSGKNIISKILSNSIFAAFSIIAWPLRYLDRWLIKKPNAHRLAFGVYPTCRKK